MSEYIARVGTSSGEIIERAFVSESEDALRRELDGKGFYIFSIDRKVGDIRMPWQRKRKIPAREFSVFNHELATLLKAGLPLLQGLDILLERMQNPFFRDMLHEIRDQVRGGTAPRWVEPCVGNQQARRDIVEFGGRSCFWRVRRRGSGGRAASRHDRGNARTAG